MKYKISEIYEALLAIGFSKNDLIEDMELRENDEIELRFKRW